MNFNFLWADYGDIVHRVKLIEHLFVTTVREYLVGKKVLLIHIYAMKSG